LNGTVLNEAVWLFRSLLTCNHWRTPVHEGKCYCPDCGRGVIYRWVVLRCYECKSRRDSRYVLRQVIPTERCCANCGHQAVRVEPLESPDYFQLHKARLMAEEETRPMTTIILTAWLEPFADEIARWFLTGAPLRNSPALLPAYVRTD